jgi:hypothetical protein
MHRPKFPTMMLAYDMPLWRPPSEGDNLIIQATIGCSFNGCSFCSMYKTKDYRARPLDQVFADIDRAARVWPDAHRVFLADGDALTLPTEDLLRILDKLAATFPALQRVTAYATPINLNHKTVEELRTLKDNRLSLVYLGIESGADAILKRIRKGATQKTMISALERALEAGLKVSATVVLGLGGRGLWEDHIDGTAEVVNRAPPTYLSTLQLHLENNVVDDFMGRFARYGDPFQWQDDAGVLAELERLLAAVNPPKPVIFRSNHASNCLPLAGNLPRDRERLLATVAAARTGVAAIRPRFMRAL